MSAEYQRPLCFHCPTPDCTGLLDLDNTGEQVYCTLCQVLWEFLPGAAWGTALVREVEPAMQPETD